MKVIFLDIDGVLNSVDSMIAFHYLKKPNKSKSLDEVSVGLLKALCEKTGAQIVVSSTWRIGRVKQNFIDIFEQYGWNDFPYLDKTPIGYDINPIGERTRGHEIQYWLERHPEVSEYLIIDDDSDMLEHQLPRFVHTNGVNGFRSKHYCQALRLFGVPNEQLELQVNFKKDE